MVHKSALRSQCALSLVGNKADRASNDSSHKSSDEDTSHPELHHEASKGMSLTSVHKEAPLVMSSTDYPPKPTYKSYRKKYLKMRHGFKDKMRESNALFEEEQHTIRIAHRLQEQNEYV